MGGDDLFFSVEGAAEGAFAEDLEGGGADGGDGFEDVQFAPGGEDHPAVGILGVGGGADGFALGAAGGLEDDVADLQVVVGVR